MHLDRTQCYCGLWSNVRSKESLTTLYGVVTVAYVVEGKRKLQACWSLFSVRQDRMHIRVYLQQYRMRSEEHTSELQSQ